MNCDSKSRGLMPIGHAKTLIDNIITRVNEAELCSLDEALDRVLSKDIVSPINVPAYNNSAMDGYAFNYADSQSSTSLHIAGKSLAGQPYDKALETNQCVRIMTGAKIPTGADTVIMQEAVDANRDTMTINGQVSQGANIRLAGGDIKSGACVFKKGHRISPVDVGLLASLGLDQIQVFRQVTVAVFSTGDELLAPGSAPQADRIFDSNRPMILSMLARHKVKTIDLGIVKDNKADIRNAFERANDLADCVITSGGVSVGDTDFTREVLDEYGEIDFWKLAIKPGKPLAFGRLPNSIFFGLPGNPVSAAVTFDQIVSGALETMAGSNSTQHDVFPANAEHGFKKRPGRTDYQRVTSFINENGELVIHNKGSQSSGVLSCFSQSNAYAILEQSSGNVEQGERVMIQPYSRNIR